MPKISALPPAGTLADDDETPFVDDSVGSTKKFTLTGLKEWMQALTSWISAAMLNYSSMQSMTAYKTVAQNTINGNTLISLGAEEHDQGSCFSTATNLFTAPATGKYHIDLGVYVTTNTGRVTPGLWKNGTFFLALSTLSGGNFISATNSIVLSLNSGDTIGLGVRNDGVYGISNTWNGVDPGTYMSIHRVG